MLRVPITRPSRRGTRLSAYQVSCPDEDTADDSALSATTSDGSRKRDRGGDGDDSRNAKRRNLDTAPPPVRKYEPRSYEILETQDLLVFGEEQDPPDDDRKRTRLLSHFTFFNADDMSMVSLDLLDEGTGGNHHVLGAGFIVARYDIDEDEGQEDGLDEEADRQYIRMSRILRFFTRYWETNSPFYVETNHAVYELDVLNPSKRYRNHFRPFWRLQTILRFVISSAIGDPNQEFSDFFREYSRIEVLGQPLTERELWDDVTRQKLRTILETIPRADTLRGSNVIKYLLTHTAPVIFKPVGKRKEAEQRLSMRDFQLDPDYRGNLDLAVLRAKIPTHVTPRIAQMAKTLFREVLQVVGPRRAEPEIPKNDLALRLQGFLMRTQTRRLIQFRPDQRIGHSRWLKHILIDGVKYEKGDTILFYPGEGPPPNPNNLPPTDTLADHFWFAKIMYMHEVYETVHVQWFQHSSKTILQELGHTQELFLTNACDTQSLKHIIGKVEAHHIKPDQSLADIKPHDYFYRYTWEEHEGTFTNTDVDAMAAAAQGAPPNYCPACEVEKKFDEDKGPTKIHLGVRSCGVDYHLDDFVLIKADEGPCHIGHIIRFDHHRGHGNDQVQVRLFGRTDKLGSRPERILKDERHLFYTNVETTVDIDDLIDICYVMIKEDMPDQWLEMSPRHFYVKYHFQSFTDADDWNTKRRMCWHDLPICRMCMKQSFKKVKGMKEFLKKEAPLRVLDPFGGTGAFALAMEDVGCFKLTHAVEISPSAAKTLRKNASPDVKVYNQCCNLVLRHAILTHENKSPEPLQSIEGHQLPPPPKPGDIDCLIAGFPCQPHSTLNMYQKANDRKSNLILTALSYADHYKPPYCIFENVRGFLQYNLRARQEGKHSVKGGIPLGGLKFVVAALLDMGYQVRCGLLQAAHYGTPQTRVRFFLIAAKRDLELPQLPQPTHDFPSTDLLELKFPGNLTLDPITTLPGVAPHRHVSVHDAISDLPKFDWKEPEKVLSRRQMEENHIKECKEDDPWCGYQGRNVPYEHEPRTRFQQHCRRRPTRDIQQYTRTYDREKVDRVVKIPVKPDADFRSLPAHLWQYQFANPASSSGRGGYRVGYYGRVQKDGWFQTTVTNVDPTAKQCRVIHPYCKRIVTVRELARSQGFPDDFVFHADQNRVVTMHRQIGNAVPWLVSVAIAREFRETFYKAWEKRNPIEEPSEVEFSSSSGSGEAMDVD